MSTVGYSVRSRRRPGGIWGNTILVQDSSLAYKSRTNGIRHHFVGREQPKLKYPEQRSRMSGCRTVLIYISSQGKEQI